MSQYVYMLQCVAPGETRVIKNEYDNRIVNTLVGARAMLVPVTPRLGMFVDPSKLGKINGMVTTPMVQMPRRLLVYGKFLLVAFDNLKAVHLLPSDILKFQKLYSPYSAPQVIQPPVLNSVEDLPWDTESTNEL